MRWVRKPLVHWLVVTRSTNVCRWLLLLCSVACGGNAVGGKPEPKPAMTPPVGKPEPQPGTAGTSSQPAPTEGGASATLPDPSCNGPQPVCAQDCTSLDRAIAECVADEQYSCPEGWVDLDSCSKDACARRSLNCCSASGHRELPECTADGLIGECPAGFRRASPCLPEGFDIESCDDLADGSACTSEAQVCYKDKCGRNCLCELDLAGKLAWRCRVNAC